MKKLTSFFLIIALCLTFTMPAIASENKLEDRVNILQNNASLFAEQFGTVLRPPIPLYNLSDELEAICYPLSPQGYIIISYKTGEIYEFSSEADCPYNGNTQSNYYNGLFQYYEKTGSIYTNTKSGKRISKTNIIEELNLPLTEISLKMQARANVVSGGLPYTLNTTISAYCVPTAVGIVLDYYQRYISGTYFPSGVITSGITAWLEQNQYIANAPQWLTEAKNGLSYNGIMYRGLTTYFSRLDITTKTVNVTPYSYNKVQTQVVTNKRPTILEIPTNLIKPSSSGNHAVTVHAVGYDTANANVMYLIVNNGWGANNVWVNSNSVSTSYDILYLS